MMNTTTPSHGNAYHHPNAATSHGDAPQPTSCPHPEWMPLDGVAQTWAGFGSEAIAPPPSRPPVWLFSPCPLKPAPSGTTPPLLAAPKERVHPL